MTGAEVGCLKLDVGRRWRLSSGLRPSSSSFQRQQLSGAQLWDAQGRTGGLGPKPARPLQQLSLPDCEEGQVPAWLGCQ